jgi:hypothetical protein
VKAGHGHDTRLPEVDNRFTQSFRMELRQPLLPPGQAEDDLEDQCDVEGEITMRDDHGVVYKDRLGDGGASLHWWHSSLDEIEERHGAGNRLYFSFQKFLLCANTFIALLALGPWIAYMIDPRRIPVRGAFEWKVRSPFVPFKLA